MTKNLHRPGALLILFAAAVLTAGLLALVGAKPAWAAELNIGQPQHFAVGSTPTTVTNADFDGDGKMDLAAQNFDTDNVSVLLGNGDGTFKDKTDFTVGDGPSAVISADFNSDELADLAVSNQNSNNVSVLLGNGDGTFRGKSDLAAGTAPTSVASADFDGDGKADLAVSNSVSNNVSIMLGNGDGTFAAAQPYSVSVGGINPNQIITDDFNGDGDVDLATAHVGHNIEIARFHGGVTVLLGNGDGTFQNARKVSLVFLNYSVASADFDNDGDRDLVATSYGMTGGCCIFGGVSVTLGNGDGTFGASRFIRVGTGHTGPSAVASADFDGDGKADLAVSNSASDDVSVMLGNGDGTFAAAQNFPANDLPAFVISPDLDANGVADLAVANQASNNVSVLMNKAADTIAPRVGSISPADGAAGVALNTNVDATFSEKMDPSTITDQTFTLTRQDSSNPMPARVIYDDAKRKATLYPAISLEANTSYTATIEGGPDGVKDASGNPLAANKVWTFSTVDTIAPSVPLITSPPNNSIDTDGNVTVSGTAEAKSTVELFEGSASRGTATADGSGNWSISLTEVGEGSHTYTAKARDAAGNSSDASNAVTVEVRIPPLVTSVSPADGTPNVAPNTAVVATFSEAMSSSTLTASTFTLTRQDSTTPVEATVSYDAATKTATLAPNAPLEANNTAYTATIEGGPDGAKDQSGNALAADKVWTFSTADTTAPTLLDVSPADAATEVPPTANVTATFSEAMDPSSISIANETFNLFKGDFSRPVAASMSYDAATNTATLDPHSPLEMGAVYLAIVRGGTGGVRDVAGNEFEGSFLWSFTIAPAPPAPVISGPANNSFDTDGTITFSGTAEAESTVDLFEVTASGATVSKGTTPVDANGTWFTTLHNVPNGSHTYKAKSKDASGNFSDFSNSLMVTVDTIKPLVDSTSPLNRATGVGRATNLTATFSEKMKASTIRATTFKLFRVNPDRSLTQITNVLVTVSPDGLKATLNPFGTTATVLAKNTKYKAVVTTGAKDLAGNSLGQPLSWTFTTR